MSTAAKITLPACVRWLRDFLLPAAACHGEGIEVRQSGTVTVVTACEGRHLATITSMPESSTETSPFLVDPAALAGGVGPMTLVRLSDTSAVVVEQEGQPQTVAITSGTLPPTAMSTAEAVAGEIASGMTKTIRDLDPRYLLAVAEMLVATGAERATVAFAPRWNVLAFTAATDKLEVSLMVAGETIAESAWPKSSEDDPLTFEIADPKKTATRSDTRAKLKPLSFEDDLPF